MAEYLIQDTTLTAIADAIRTKTGGTEAIDPADMANTIEAIDSFEVAEVSVTPDFSAGDMEVVPEDGQVFSKVSIPKPANLLPENIAEGVDIAGIIGTLAASGGGGLVKFGVINPGSVVSKTITHDLGVVPDVFILSMFSYGSATRGIPLMWSVSKAFAEANGMAKYGMYVWKYNASTIYFNAQRDALDATTASSIGLSQATPSTVVAKANGSSYPLLAENYLWVAIGGLT